MMRGASLVFVNVILAHFAWAASYDPLVVDPNFHPKVRDQTVHDAARNRDIPVRIYFPPNNKPAPVVLFSHGLGGSRESSKFLGERWAARGYLVVFVQHPGSDEFVWKNAPPAERMEALRKAASLENFFLRVGDIRAVLDQLQAWNKNGPLANRMDLTRIGMSGHSFGAVTTQAVTGETFVMSGTELTDPRIRAAVIMSPSTPKSETAERAFGDVKIPWLEQKTSRRLARRMRMRGSRYIPHCTACRNIRSCSTMPIIRSSPIGRCPAIAAGAT